MVETFGAHYVSLHVRVSNQAAIHLYKTTLGFQTEKTEAKYYADGEDAFSMRLDLAPIREQLQQQLEAEADAEADEDGASEGVDEGEAVGDVGSDPAKKKSGGKTKKKSSAAAAGAGADGGKEGKRKVKVGRGLGVGELVERDESKHS